MDGLSEYGSQSSTGVEVSGFTENMEMLGRLMTSDHALAVNLRKVISQVLKEARKRLSNDAKSVIADDPMKAARAVKSSVYKAIFGGNLSILARRRAGAKYELRRHRKLDDNPRQRGGNRVKRVNDERNRLSQYFGADRGFILRFINSGTVSRRSRYGNRGAIPQGGWFGHVATWQMEQAAQEVADAITEYVKSETR